LNIERDAYGKHLILDVTVNKEDRDALTNREYCGQYIDKVTEICGMQPVIPTISMRFPFSNEHCGLVKKMDAEGVKSPTLEEHKAYVKAKEDNDTGVSAISVWNTSHSSLHSWSEEDYISIDLYSCNNFDERPVIDFTKEYFKVKEMRIVQVLRHITEPQVIKQWSE